MATLLVFVAIKEVVKMGEEYEYIYVAYITTKRGRRIYARERGLQALRIKGRKRKPEEAA